MTRIHKQVDTALPIEDAFAYLADFAHSEEWDPGTVSARRLDDGPIGPGTRYALEVRMGGRVAPMEYRIRDYDSPHRVVLVGSGSGVDAVDEIRFERRDEGTRIDYTADIRLGGILRFVQPLLGRAFDRIGRDAAVGMELKLAERAHQRAGGTR